MREALYFLRGGLLPKYSITNEVLSSAPKDDKNIDNINNNDDS